MLPNEQFKSISFKNLVKIIYPPPSENKDEPEHLHLKNFIKKFYCKLKAANTQKVEHKVNKQQSALDAFARLLVGDEVCCSIAISDNKLLLATNEHLHLDDRIEYKLSYCVVRKRYKPFLMDIVFTATLVYCQLNKTPYTIPKKSKKIVYGWNRKNKFRLRKIKEFTIKFSQHEHGIKFPNNDDVTIKILVGLEKRIDKNLLLNIPQNMDIYLKPTYIKINPLRRRTTKLINNLALIAHSILTKPELEYKVSNYMENNDYWAQFLHDSLSYELSKKPAYKTHIFPWNFGDAGMRDMLEFYKRLINDYQNYKIDNGLINTKQSIKSWLSTIPEKLREKRISAPRFIIDQPDDFIELANRYFRDLVEVEEFVRNDANVAKKSENGCLAKILVGANLFKHNITVEVIDGIPKKHAEMRLLEKHLEDNLNLPNPMDNYYGITMLCCALCTYTMQQFNIAGYRGTHNVLFGGWILGDIIKRPKYFNIFLGEELYNLYKKLSKSPSLLIPNAKNEKIKQDDLALMLINNISGFNNKEKLRSLGLDSNFLFPNLKHKDLYPCSQNMEIDNNHYQPVFSTALTEQSKYLLSEEKSLEEEKKVQNHNNSDKFSYRN